MIDIKAVTFRFDPPYTYTSGIKSPIYLDNRIVMSYPAVREKIIDYYIRDIKEKLGLKNVEWISATASAAIPHGAWIAGRMKLPMVYVRPTTKKYGKGNQIEGYLKKGSKVLIIEDHISTGTSAVGNARAVRKAGGVVKYCVATTSYETDESIKLFKSHSLILIVLTTGAEIVNIAYKEGRLSKKEKEKVDLWFEDPVTLAKKIGV